MERNSFDKIRFYYPCTEEILNLTWTKSEFDEECQLKRRIYNQSGISIKLNQVTYKLVIEISSKLLGSRYSEKIKYSNFDYLLESINQHFPISKEKLLSIEPIGCHVTSDITRESIGSDIAHLFNLCKLQSKYQASPKYYKAHNEPTSFYLKKKVLTGKYCDYISIYNKGNELEKKNLRNDKFFNLMNPLDADRIINESKNVLRFEKKLNSTYLIKKAFGFNGSHTLEELLLSPKNIIYESIREIYMEAIKYEDCLIDNLNYKDFDRYNTLKLYDFDLDKILAVQIAMGNKRQKSKILKPYKDLSMKLGGVDFSNDSIDSLRSILKQLKNV